MTNKKIEKDIIAVVARQTGIVENTAKKICDALFEEIFKNLDQCRAVTIQDFGTFYIKATEPRRTFKFNPSQRLRRSFGWSSR